MSDSKDLALDLGEIALDALFEDGLIKEIPVLRSLFVIASTTASIPDRIFAAKACRFLSALPRFTQEERIRFIQDLEGDQKRKEQLSEIIVLSLDRTDRLRKADLMAKLFTALLRMRISDSEFDSLSTAVVQCDLSLLDVFLDKVDKHEKHDPPDMPIGLEQLLGSGLTRPNGTPSMDQSGTFTRASKLGLTLYRILYTNE